MLQLTSVSFKRGTFLLLEGALANDRFYIIQSGRVACSATLGMGRNVSRILSTGDFVGVIPCMSGHTQIENVVAIDDVRCILIDKEQYSQLIVNNPAIAVKIIKAFAKRTRSMNEQFTKLTLRGAGNDSSAQIFNVAMFYDTEEKYDIAYYAYSKYLEECPNGEDVKKAQERCTELKEQVTLPLKNDDPKKKEYEAGQMIMCEGEKGPNMFSIAKGTVAIVKIVDGVEVVLAVLHDGAMFGEMAVLEEKPRSASAIARTDCTLNVITRKDFDMMARTSPTKMSRLTTMLADRIFFMYRQLSCALLQVPLHRVIDMLSIQLEKEKQTMGPYQIDMSAEDLVNMCGFATDKEKEEALTEFLHKNIVLQQENNTMFIQSCQSVFQFDILYKRQEAKEQRPAGRGVLRK